MANHLGCTASVASKYPPWQFYLIIIAQLTLLKGIVLVSEFSMFESRSFWRWAKSVSQVFQDDCVSENEMYVDMPWIEQDTENKIHNNIPVVHVRRNHDFLLLLGFICWALSMLAIH